MKKSVKFILYCAGATAFTSTLTIACAPYFPWQLLDNRKETLLILPNVSSFAKKASELVTVTEKEKQNLYSQSAQQGLTHNYHSSSCPNTDDAYKQAALLFHNKQWDEAYLPFTQLAYNSSSAQQVCAQYTLGMIEVALGKKEDAVQSFNSTAYLVAHGSPDPLHLGMDAYGQAAGVILDQIGVRHDESKGGFIKWSVGDVKPDSVLQLMRAVNLYARQAALGYNGGVASLIVIIDGLSDPNNPNAANLLEQSISEPLIRQLLLDYVLNSDISYQNISKPQIQSILHAFTKAVDDKKDMGMDMAALAAFAYQNHDMEHAQKWAQYDWDKYHKSIDAWVLAKIALMKGDKKQAQDYYHQAISHMKDDTVSFNAQQRMQGEQAVLTLAQGGFVQALEQLWPVRDQYWGDVVYLAENVLTPDELRHFVNIHTQKPEDSKSVYDASHYNDAIDILDADNNRYTLAGRSLALRHLLARRLMRVGRLQEAIPYFAEPGDINCKGLPRHVRIEQAYLKATNDMYKSFWATDRAKSAWKAANILRDYGMELMGTSGYPDQYPGYYSYGISQNMGPKNDFNNKMWSVPEEQVRTGVAWPIPNRRFHYRYLAVEDVLYATRLIPHQSQAYAAMLCHANGWMQNSSYYNPMFLDADHEDPKFSLGSVNDPQFAYAQSVELYNLYLKNGPAVPFAKTFGYHCPQPEFHKIPALKRDLFWKNIRASIKIIKGQ